MLHIITKTQRDNKNSRRYIRERIRSNMYFYFCLLWDWISRLKLKIQNSNNKSPEKPLYLTDQKTVQKSTNFALKENHKDITIKNEMEYTPLVYHASNQLVFFSTLPTTKSNANFASRGTYNNSNNNNKANNKNETIHPFHSNGLRHFLHIDSLNCISN